MIQQLLSQITPFHLFLAYLGMILHILMKLSELSKVPNFTIRGYVKNNVYTMIATFIMIPVLLIMVKDPSIKDMLPINNVTAVLAGWQTNSAFKTIMSMFGKKNKGKIGNYESENKDENIADEDKKHSDEEG